MRNSVFSPQRMLLCVLACLCAGIFSQTAIAQETTSNLRVVVSDAAGNRINGVDVRITHGPTGRSQVLTSTDGTVTAVGLQIGGPYSVEAADATQYAAEDSAGIFLSLGETEVVQLTVSTRSALEEVTVTGTQTIMEEKIGVGSSFSRQTIEGIPSISRDFVSTLSVDPSILVDNSVARGPAVSIAGQNFRFNSVTIDGVAQNDNFGLSKNASATPTLPDFN